MFIFSGIEAISKIEKQISNIVTMLENNNLTPKEEQKLEFQFENLTFELRRLNQSREWFDQKNLQAFKSFDKTKRQTKHENHLRKFVVAKTPNSRTKKFEGVSLIERHIAEGNKEEAQRLLNKMIYQNEIQPQLEVIAAGIELDLISFVAEDIW